MSIAIGIVDSVVTTYFSFVQGMFLVRQIPADMGWHPHHVCGLLVWLAGWLLVVQADGILRGLRKPHETGELLLVDTAAHATGPQPSHCPA
jgi:hypothetical protein